MQRAVRFLVAEVWIRQIIDIGTGIPPPGTCTRSPGRPRRRPAWSTPTTTVASRVVHTPAGLVRRLKRTRERKHSECPLALPQSTGSADALSERPSSAFSSMLL
jgi:hypothetical protein